MKNETKRHYHTKDIDRYQSLPFVVGYEIRRSNNKNHECSICQNMSGKYPKSFRFIGWCNSCRCSIISILITAEEMDKLQKMILNEEDLSTFESVNEVKVLPPNALSYINENINEIKELEWYNLNEKLIKESL